MDLKNTLTHFGTKPFVSQVRLFPKLVHAFSLPPKQYDIVWSLGVDSSDSWSVKTPSTIMEPAHICSHSCVVGSVSPLCPSQQQFRVINNPKCLNTFHNHTPRYLFNKVKVSFRPMLSGAERARDSQKSLRRLTHQRRPEKGFLMNLRATCVCSETDGGFLPCAQGSSCLSLGHECSNWEGGLRENQQGTASPLPHA